MTGVAAHSSPQCDRVPAAPRQKGQIGAVCVVHQQRHAQALADLCQPLYVLHIPQIVRAGQVDAKGAHPLTEQLLQTGAETCRRDRAAAQTAPLSLRPQPLDFKIQQGSTIHQRFMCIACRQQDRTALPCRCGLHGQQQHSPNTLRGPARTIIGGRRAEQLGSICLALRNDAFCLIQLICPCDLGQVQGFAPQKGYAFVPWHMQPGRA